MVKQKMAASSAAANFESDFWGERSDKFIFYLTSAMELAWSAKSIFCQAMMLGKSVDTHFVSKLVATVNLFPVPTPKQFGKTAGR